MQSPETKIENLRVHALAKIKIRDVVARIERQTRIRPSLTEAIIIMADAYLTVHSDG